MAFAQVRFGRIRIRVRLHVRAGSTRRARGRWDDVAMGRGISEVLPFAVGVAISPIPIIGVILMLLSARARVNGPAFLVGWVVGLTVLGLAVYVVADTIGVTAGSRGSDGVSWLKVGLGVALLSAARRSWSKRPAPGVEPELPRWMADIEAIAPSRAAALGFALSALNPKNLLLTVGASAGLAQLGLDAGDAIVAFVVFVAVASSTVAVAVGYELVGGERARHSLAELKAWLAPNSAAVMAVILVVFGAVLISQGIGLLSA